MAGDPKATAVLLGLGLDCFSMSASFIPEIKKTVLGLKKKSCEKLAEKALCCRSGKEVLQLLQHGMIE
jgi:phosphotransferase system enzyme I (PtsI)